MAATKDVFEPKVFASNTFAAGAFRGAGVDATSPDKISLAWTAPRNRLDYTPPKNRLDYTPSHK